MEGISSSDAKLFNSTISGDKEGVMAALAQGGRVTLRNSQGYTPLLTAAQNGHTDICSLLLAHGSNVHDRDHGGLTPLLVAAQNGHANICGLLLAHGINVNEVKPDTKDTALHLAGEQKSTHRAM